MPAEAYVVEPDHGVPQRLGEHGYVTAFNGGELTAAAAARTPLVRLPNVRPFRVQRGPRFVARWR